MLLLLESIIFPGIEEVVKDCLTSGLLLPELCHLLSQMVHSSRSSLSMNYIEVVSAIFSAEPWVTVNDAAALVRLIQAVLLKNPPEIRWSKVFQMLICLVSSPKAVGEGISGLTLLVGGTLSYREISPFMTQVWEAVSSVDQVPHASRVLLMSLFVVKHGVEPLIRDLNAVRGSNFETALEKLWIPGLLHVREETSVKLAVVAGTYLLCDPYAFEHESSHARWGLLLENIMRLLLKKKKKKGSESIDALAEVTDPKLFFLTSLAKLTDELPGKYPNIFRNHVDKGLVAALKKFCDDNEITVELPPVETNEKKK